MTPPVELRILFVEDHEEIREALTTVLESEGYVVTSRSSAEQGLEELRNRHFDLVLTDYSLPERSGTWMVRTAREQGVLNGAQVLVVTAHPSPEGAEGLRVIHKPLDLDDFLDEVHTLLAPVRAERFGKLAHGDLRTGPLRHPHDARVELSLYISSHSPVSLRAMRNLHRLLDEYRGDQVKLTVVDLSREHPPAAMEDRIAFTPTLVKRYPDPKSWIVGDFDDPRYVSDLLTHAGVERKR